MTKQEAIERIKARFDKLALDDKDIKAIQTLIPELHESEDEKMLREIKRYIKEQGNKPTGLPNGTVAVADMIAWLEKQKENTEKEYIFRPLAGTDIASAALQAIQRVNEGDHLVLAFNGAYIPVRKGCNANKIVDIYDAFIEKQKEQKPNIELIQRSWYMEGYNDRKFGNEPKWIIKTREGGPRHELNPRYGQPLAEEQKPVHTAKEMWKEMRLEVYAQASGNRHEPNYSDDSTKMFSLCDIDEIFEKIGNSTVGSQPAEWSEEDEIMLNAAIEMVENSNTVFCHEVNNCKVSSWLKSLRPPLKDKEMKLKILKYLSTRCSSLEFEEVEDYLNNLRPSWKPSKEQMEALKEALETYKGFEEYDAMKSLYNELKKLM